MSFKFLPKQPPLQIEELGVTYEDGRSLLALRYMSTFFRRDLYSLIKTIHLIIKMKSFNHSFNHFFLFYSLIFKIIDMSILDITKKKEDKSPRIKANK